MNKIELIIFSVMAVISAFTLFDFMTYVLKSAPKRSYFTKPVWRLGFLTTICIVYWYMNGMKFF